MNMKHKLQAALAAGLMVLGLGAVQRAQAAGVNPDTMVVAVTPGNLTYGVSISSPLTSGTTGYDFGTVALGATTISTLAIQVKSSGTVSEFFSLAVSNSSPDVWAPVSSATPGLRQFRMMGRITAANTQPLDSVFADSLTTSAPTPAGSYYGQSRTDPGTIVYLWLRLTMPDQVVTQLAQTMTVTVNGQNQ